MSEVYLNGGDKWIYASEYAKAFPGLSYTALLRDYNGDGAADLFAHSGDTGVDGYIVYQGYYDNDTLRFQQLFLEYAEPYLKYEDEVGTEQILLIESDVYPSISDLDGDGDLDFISIKTSGGYFEMYRNTSIENGWGLDSLTFMKDVECFGGVREEGGQSLMLASTSNLCAPLRSVADSENIHGGYSFLSFDNDGDGNKDLLFGDRSYPSMNMLWNGNNDNSPHFTSQDTFFPSDNIPVNVSIGPVSFLIDGDFDGMKDIVVSSRSCPLDKDSYTLFYRNMGTNISPIFEQTEEDWLGNTMMDYGKFNHPTFTDYNQDGLMDLVVATQVIRLSPNYF
ncbi:MAG: hypothetical protein ACPG5P_09505, partial [Saprospiraceae bacterium]